MLSVLVVTGYVLFVLVLIGAVLASALSLPGTILVLVDGLVFSACTHWQRPGWPVLLVLAVLAVVAETSDNVLSAIGTRYGGGSSKTGWIALAGGIVGGLVGAALSPLFGSVGLLAGILSFVVGVLIVPLGLAVLGGYLAVLWYELKLGRPVEEARQAAKGALFGRLLGVMSKSLLTVIMSGILLWTVFVKG